MKQRVILMSLICLLIVLFTGCTKDMNDPDNTKASQYDNLAEYYEEDMAKAEYDVVKAKVVGIEKDDTDEVRDIPIQQDIRYQYLKVRISNGPHKGEEYTVRNTVPMVNPYRLIFKEGESMLIYVYETEEGKVGNIHIYERVRDTAILWLVVAFLAFLALIGGLKGVKAVITLTFTVLMIAFVMLPLILRGWNPILISLAVVSVTTTVSLIIISGWNKKTRTAILGTVGGVLVAALIAGVVGQVANLTGLGDEQAQMLAYIPQNRHLDFKGILLAGIIVGALGAVMDVALSVASSMWEIEEHSPNISRNALMKSGMNIGKDIMGSMSNTLILAYVGGALQLLLLFIAYNISMAEIINMDMIASEVVRAVAGSFGLIATIPLTTWIGGTFGRRYCKEQKKKK